MYGANEREWRKEEKGGRMRFFRRETVINMERKNFLRSFGQKCFRLSNRDDLPVKPMQQIEFFRNIGKENVHKLKRLYYFNFDNADNWNANCIVFYLEKDPTWFIAFPAWLSTHVKSFNFNFGKKNGQFSIPHILPFPPSI
jgi:hypothetical protein